MRRHIAGIGGKTIDTFFDNRCCYREQPLGVSDASIDINFEGVTCVRANLSNFIVCNQSTRSTSYSVDINIYNINIPFVFVIEFRVVFERINTQFVFAIRLCNISVSRYTETAHRQYFEIFIQS